MAIEADGKISLEIFEGCTNLIAVFRLRNSKNVYPLNCLLIITTCFAYPTGHHQVIQYLVVFLNYNHFN
jgi:hypothetical protein